MTTRNTREGCFKFCCCCCCFSFLQNQKDFHLHIQTELGNEIMCLILYANNKGAERPVHSQSVHCLCCSLLDTYRQFSFYTSKIVCGFSVFEQINLSRATRKPTFCNCENKDADQLRLQSLYFLNPKFQASSHLL